MEEVIDLILQGVSIVPKCGYPGSLVVFDQAAVPILTGDNTSSIVFAAAQFGKGRIFVTSHEAYIHHFIENTPDFYNLWKNIKSWLVNDYYVRDKDIPNIENYELVSDIPEDVKLLKWIGTQNKTEIFIHHFLKNYVANGGNVLCGICPWGWLSISHGRTLDEMSLNKFISACGISFSADICILEKNFFQVCKNLALESHLGNALKRLSENSATSNINKDLIINGLDSLSHQAAIKFVEKLNKVLLPSLTEIYKPTYSLSVKTKTGISLLAIASKLYQKYTQLNIETIAPNISEFPADFADPPNKVTGITIIKSKFNEFHCSGYYMEAGSSVKVTVLEGSTTGWEIRVGAHTDDLSSMSCLKRWPLIFSKSKLKRQMVITSAFGGLIYLDSPNGNSTIKLKLENVIESPFLDLNQPDTFEDWRNRSYAPGLWAEVCGKHIIFTVPSQTIREITLMDLKKVLNLWDLIVVANHELRGTNVNNCSRERVVVDIQPFGDKMHSGYPIVIPYVYIIPSSNLYIFDVDKIKSNGWNLIHELGHNMTRACWTPSGTEEVTVNIFTLHAFHLVLNQKPLINQLLTDKLPDQILQNYSKGNFEFKDWKSNPYIGLLIYLQLINAFGWNAFKIIYREYESLTEKERLLTTDLTKWDEWITRFSNIVGLDVSPLFFFWNIPFTERTSANLNDLTPWLPNDEISKLFTDRVNFVKKNYNGLLFGNESLFSSCPKIMYPDDFVFDSIEKLDSLNPNKTSFF